MKNMGGTSKYIAFVDECGDHSMEKIDKDFPLFVLATVIVERQAYAKEIVPAMADFKLRYWNHEGINLHSRDIRKAIGPFSFLHNKEKREVFMSEWTRLMEQLPYTVFITGIMKHSHLEKNGKQAANPYELSLEFTLEKLASFLKNQGETELPIVVEARGKKEDESLERVFYKIMMEGTSLQSSEVFRALDCPLVFRSKKDNIAGIQLADLCAHPCARHILKSAQKNMSYDIVSSHIYKEDGLFGWKVFP